MFVEPVERFRGEFFRLTALANHPDHCVYEGAVVNEEQLLENMIPSWIPMTPDSPRFAEFPRRSAAQYDDAPRVQNPTLILNGLFRVVDHQSLNGAFSGFQFEPELLLHRHKDGYVGRRGSIP